MGYGNLFRTLRRKLQPTSPIVLTTAEFASG